MTKRIRPTCEECGFTSPGGSHDDHLYDGWSFARRTLCDECSQPAHGTSDYRLDRNL